MDKHILSRDAKPVSALRTAGGALVNWWRAMTLDALLVGILWFVGLEILHVPLAPLWALLGAVLQFVPGVGGILAVAGPAISTVVAGGADVWYHLAFVLGLYAIIVVVDGLLIQPLILKRTTLVPWWASLLGTLVMGFLIPGWGVLLAAPLLAIAFAFIKRPKPGQQHGV